MNAPITDSLVDRLPLLNPESTQRTVEIALRFGLNNPKSDHAKVDPSAINPRPGTVTLLTGPSGSGKSTTLQYIAQKLPMATDSTHERLPSTLPIIDIIAPHAPLADALECLAAAGLTEAPLWLKTPDQLSDGERFRAQLARAVARRCAINTNAPLLCDEFCSILHRRLARAIAHNIRKLTTRYNLITILATANDDIIDDLQPDTVIRFSSPGQSTVENRASTHTSTTGRAQLPQLPRLPRFLRRLRITPGRKRDYHQFASLHYRATDELGFTDKIFLLRERDDGDILGIIVFAYPPYALALRNRATRNRFNQNPKSLNEHLRIIRRLVLHPDIRGCGVGHRFVRKTLPLAGVTYVECLAAMGSVNPVFEKAGMKKIGVCELPSAQTRAIAELSALGVDPLARDFTIQVARKPRIRKLVMEVVRRWYQATSGGGRHRVEKQSPRFLAQTFRGVVGARPVYYLWKRPRQRPRGTDDLDCQTSIRPKKRPTKEK